MKTRNAKYYERLLNILNNAWIGFGIFLLVVAETFFIIGLIQLNN